MVIGNKFFASNAAEPSAHNQLIYNPPPLHKA